MLWFVVGAGCSALIALAALLMYAFSPLPLPSVASPLAASHWVILRGVDSSRNYVNVPLPLSD